MFSEPVVWSCPVRDIEQNFRTSVPFNDTDVFTFGINNFDPNKVFRLDNEDIGSNDSVSRRKNITRLAFPYTFELPFISRR